MDGRRYQAAVVGGGLVGSALALSLARHGLATALIERVPPEDHARPDFDGRAYAVTPASRNVLAALGVWDDVAPSAGPISRIEVVDRAPGPVTPAGLIFDPWEAGQRALGHIVEDHVLRGALLAARAAADRLEVIAPAEVTGLERLGWAARLTLADGRAVEADLVIAADGRRSLLAQEAGIPYAAWEYGQTGLVAAVAHDLPHHGLAHQAFFPGGPFAVLPMSGERSALVWSERRAVADRLAALADRDYLTAVAGRIGGRLGRLELIGKRWAYPLSFALAHRFAVPRLVVAGDAAHGVHPIAGQGMNLGLGDVAALTEVLVEARRLGLDLGAPAVLARYERWRRFETARLSLGIDALNRLFSTDLAPAQALRNLGLGLVGRLGPARRAIMEIAAGTDQDAPRLARGEPI